MTFFGWTGSSKKVRIGISNTGHEAMVGWHAYTGGGLAEGEEEGELVGEHVRLLRHAQHKHHPQRGNGAHNAEVKQEHVDLVTVVGRVQVVDGQELGCQQLIN